MMAWAYTVDARPHVMGDMVMFTGTFTNDSGSTGGNVTLTNLLVNVFAAGATAGPSTAGSGAGVDGVFCLVARDTSAITIQSVADQTGTWFALGRRS